MSTRRHFLTSVATAAAAFTATGPVGEIVTGLDQKSGTLEATTLSERWLFRLDTSASHDPARFAAGDSGWSTIQIPHTWQTLGQSPDYVGVAWYRLELYAPADWQKQFVRLEFEAVSHTAHVYLNGRKIGEHIGKGYTDFTCDATPALAYGKSNTLLVRVENS